MEDNIHLKITKQCLAAVGFWPLTFKWKIFAAIYAIYYIITITCFAVFVFTQFVELYIVTGKSLEEFSGLMAINFLYTLGLVKVWVIGGPIVKTLVTKIQVTERNILESGDETIKEIYLKHVEKTYNANRLMIVLGVMCYFTFMLTPVFVELTDPTIEKFETINDDDTIKYLPRPLPLVSWFPFDRYKYYFASYSWHVVMAYVNTTYIVGCNNMFFALMIFAAGQIKILQHYILTLKTSTDGEQDELLDVIVTSNLRKIIIYHNAIIRFIRELDRSMRFFLLLDFAACALQIAMIIFEIAVAELSFQLLKNTIYIGSMVTQLFLFYWHGNEIYMESGRVSDAVWECPWYECNNGCKKTLQQIMMRAQKPLKLSVGSFYHMSTQTMVTILRSSYTYAALMRQFYVRKAHN